MILLEGFDMGVPCYHHAGRKYHAEALEEFTPNGYDSRVPLCQFFFATDLLRQSLAQFERFAARHPGGGGGGAARLFAPGRFWGGRRWRPRSPGSSVPPFRRRTTRRRGSVRLSAVVWIGSDWIGLDWIGVNPNPNHHPNHELSVI